VIEREPVRQRRIKIAIDRRVHEVLAETRMPGQRQMMKMLFQERFRRSVMLGADADTERREIVEEEIHPMIRRHNHQHIGPRRHQPLADLAETFLHGRAGRRRIFTDVA
jgi:hypothetical protein